jgi:hypothetical protein
MLEAWKALTSCQYLMRNRSSASQFLPFLSFLWKLHVHFDILILHSDFYAVPCFNRCAYEGVRIDGHKRVDHSP